MAVLVDYALLLIPITVWLLALATIPSVLLRREGRPTAALSWLLALFAMPYLALPIWWLIGRTHLQRRKRKRRRAEIEFGQRLAAAGQLGTTGGEPDALSPPAAVANFPVRYLPADVREGVFLPTSGNTARLLVDGAKTYEVWEAAIRSARDHIHLLFYIWNDDSTGQRLLQALCEAAARGVEVRLCCDSFGTPHGSKTFTKLVQAGGKTGAFLPLRLRSLGRSLNFRNHRKLIVVDGSVAYMGGINVGDEYLTWHDMAVELVGPAVTQAQEVFCEDWFFVTGEDLAHPRYFRPPSQADVAAETQAVATCGAVGACIVASGPSQRINATNEMLFVAMGEAHTRLWITTPYFIPDPAMLLALRAARYRGADVRLMLPADNDVKLVRRASRAFYPQLIEAGVRVFEYPGMVHAKTLVVDDHLSMVGSANLDPRSLRLHFELGCFLASPEFNAHLGAVHSDSFARSREIAQTDPRRVHTRLIDAAAQVASPLL